MDNSCQVIDEFQERASLVRSLPANRRKGSTLEDFLIEEGILEECTAKAEKALRSLCEQPVYTTE